MWRAFLIALQFLTRLPVSSPKEAEPAELGRSLLCYPLVGAVIGGILAIEFLMLPSGDAGLLAVLVLIVWVALTGALHLDGLADTADAWIGGHGDRKRSLAIMKDAQSGPAAVTAVTLLLLLKYVSLNILLSTDNAGFILLTVPAAARAAAVGLLLTTPYVRPGGIGALHAKHVSRRGGAMTLLFVAFAVPLLCGLSGLALLLAVFLLTLIMRSWMKQRLGGTTGDTAGALIEITEAGGLAALALVLS